MYRLNIFGDYPVDPTHKVGDVLQLGKRNLDQMGSDSKFESYQRKDEPAQQHIKPATRGEAVTAGSAFNFSFADPKHAEHQHADP